MAQSFIDKYVFALMLDSSNFEKGATLATKAANGIKDTMLKTYTALGGINLFKNMLTDYTDAARNIDMLNILTGENTVQLQAWEKTIQDTGGNVNAFRSSLRGLNESLAQFKNFGQVDNKIVALFKQGISPTGANGNWKKGTELLKDIAGAIRKIKDESSAWSWASAMGIDESTFRMMRMHGEQLDDIIKKNERWAIINKQDIETTRKYDLIISSFKTSWLDLSRTIMSELLPVLQDKLFPEIKNGLEYFKTNKGTIIEGIRTIAELAERAAEGFKTIGEGIGLVAAEIVGEQEKNVQKHGKVLGTAATIGGMYKDTLNYWGGPLMLSPTAYASQKAAQYIINVSKMNVNGENAQEIGQDIADKAGTYNNLGAQTVGGQSL